MCRECLHTQHNMPQHIAVGKFRDGFDGCWNAISPISPELDDALGLFKCCTRCVSMRPQVAQVGMLGSSFDLSPPTHTHRLVA